MIEDIREDEHYADAAHEVVEELAEKIKESTNAALGPVDRSPHKRRTLSLPELQALERRLQVAHSELERETERLGAVVFVPYDAAKDPTAGINLVNPALRDLSNEYRRLSRLVSDGKLARKYEQGERRFVRSRPRRLVGMPDTSDEY